MDEEDQEFFDAEEDLFVDCEDNVNLQSETEDSEPSSNVHETSLEVCSIILTNFCVCFFWLVIFFFLS